MEESNIKTKCKSKQSPKLIFWVIGILSLCLLGFIFIAKSSSKEASMDYENQPYLGKESAPVKIIEFGDYKCPVCKNFNETIFPLIQNDLIETGKVQFYFMNYSFINTDSTRTAKFAEAVYDVLGKDDFWRFHEVIYQKQPYDPSLEKVDIFTDAFLLQTLTEVLGDEKTEKVQKVYKDGKYSEALDEDMLYVNKLKVSGTPTLFINGKKFEGHTFEELKQAVEEAAGRE